MSSINTNNAYTTRNAYPSAKIPTNPKANPIQPATNTSRTGSGDATNTGKVSTAGQSPIRAADTGTESNAAIANPVSPAEAKALDTAHKLVSTTLIKPILAQARATRDAPAPWGQTQAEKQFGSLLDNRIADDIAKSSSFPIAQRIAQNILKNSQAIDPAVLQAPQQPVQQYTPTDIFG